MATEVVGFPVNYSIPLFWNQSGSFGSDFEYTDQNFYTWLRSLNTQKWYGPYLNIGTIESNARYARWYIQLGEDWADNHKNGFYQWVLTPPFPGGDEPTIGINPYIQGLVKIISDPGGDPGVVEYESNNEDREADTYFRPNY